MTIKVSLYYSEKKADKLKDSISEVKNIIKQNNMELVDLKYNPDLLISLGGDGTILRSAQLLLNKKMPLLGISAGYLGFLAEVKLEELGFALKSIISKQFQIDTRNFLEVNINNKTDYALNEVAIKSSHLKVAEIELYLNELYLTTYKADGLIVSSSTGSTAYNLSAGGPIIFPDTEAIIITPICPHSLTVRSLVVSPKDSLKIKVLSDGVYASVDGHKEVLAQEIKVKFSKKTIDFIRFRKDSFIDGLRNKLGWSGHA